MRSESIENLRTLGSIRTYGASLQSHRPRKRSNLRIFFFTSRTHTAYSFLPSRPGSRSQPRRQNHSSTILRCWLRHTQVHLHTSFRPQLAFVSAAVFDGTNHTVESFTNPNPPRPHFFSQEIPGSGTTRYTSAFPPETPVTLWLRRCGTFHEVKSKNPTSASSRTSGENGTFPFFFSLQLALINSLAFTG